MAGYVLRSFKIKIEQFACANLLDFPKNMAKFGTKYTHICSFRKYTFYYQDPLHFADVSIFSVFWQKLC